MGSMKNCHCNIDKIGQMIYVYEQTFLRNVVNEIINRFPSCSTANLKKINKVLIIHRCQNSPRLLCFDYFLSFFLLCEVSLLFGHEMLSKCMDSGYLVGATPRTVFHRLF